MFAQTGRSRSGTLTAIAVAILFAAGTAQAAPITIDTGTITINGIDSGGSIAGTGFTTRIVSAGGGNAGGLTEFVFQGDLDLANHTVSVVGRRAASLFVGGNADLTGSSFELSANGRLGTAGGGDGRNGFHAQRGLPGLGLAARRRRTA